MTRLRLALVLAVSLVACGDEEPPPSASSDSAVTPDGSTVADPRSALGLAISPSFDVGAVMRTVHFAYRRDPGDDSFSGGHSTYAVRASATRLAVTPWKDGVAGAAAAFEAATIQRGGQALPGNVAQPVTLGVAGSLSVPRGAVIEHLVNREDGVEQSWTFAAAPAGHGDVVVRVAVSGQSFIGETEHGLHFGDPHTGLGVRYGHATWVDATGATTEVPARYDAGAVVLAVPAAVIDSAAYPAVLDPVIGPEVGMDTPINVTADGGQVKPAIASDGSNYLVVWSDARAGGQDIWGARVSAAGVLTDTTGIEISSAINDQIEPAVTFGGGQYFVTWDDQRSGADDIYGARVRTTGAVLDVAGIAISTAAGAQVAPAVAFGGTTYFVVWQDRRGATDDIYGQGVTAATGVLNGTNLAISTAANAQQSPAIAFDGTSFTAVWQDDRTIAANFDIYAQRISAAGALVAANLPVSVAASSQTVPAIAFNGSTYLVAWADARTSANTDIYGARVTTAGVVTDAAGILLSRVNGGSGIPANVQTTPAVSTVGASGDFAVVWQDFRTSATDSDIYGTRVTNAGAVSDVPSRSITVAAGSQQAPVIAYNGTSYLVAWMDPRNAASGDIYAARVSTALAVNVADFPVSKSSNSQRAAAIAYSGTNYLVVWQDFRPGGSSDIYGARMSTVGAVLDASGIAIATAANNQLAPTVAFDGTQYMVAWEDLRNGNPDIFAQRVTTAGALTGTNITVSTAANAQQTPSIARNAATGTGTLVVWADTRTSAATDVYGARITSAGVVSDAGGIPISTAAGSQTQPSLGHDGTSWVATWTDTRSGTADIFAARITSAGAVADAAGRQITSAAGAQSSPSITAMASGSLIVWQDDRTGAASSDIYGQRIDTAAALTGTEIAISTAASSQVTPSVSFDGNYGFVVWSDDRGGSGDIYGARVTGAGAVLATDTAGIVISAASTVERNPRIVSNGAGKLVVAYQLFDPTVGLGSVRVRARMITDQPNGITCTSGASCESGNCVDGVCCNSTCGGGVATDCQACSVATGAAVDGTCGPSSVTTICRASTGLCDAAETCNGVALTCPANALSTAGTVCRAAGGACDIAEVCNGSSAACPTDALAPVGTLCRAAVAGGCDVKEVCTGAATCPADTVVAAGTQCRAAAGPCDVAESCTGTNACPTDTFRPSGTGCRPSAGICDVAEACTGGAAACPPDAFQPATTTCRPATGACDAPERCRGNGPACPSDSVVCCESDCGDCDAVGVCGNGVCSGFETCQTCPADCGACAAFCGDLTCNGGETCATCARDCGACASTCGNGICSGNESCATCSADCGVCPVICGDAVCSATESCSTCARDCGACAGVCGNGVCAGAETCSTCPADCGSCAGTCGNGVCSSSEKCWSCPLDCGACPACGDGVCAAGESCASCAPDCGVCARCGDGSCLGGETCSSCPSDCGTCPSCGDGSCLDTESCLRCPADCGTCNDETCGDGVCSVTESCTTCSDDCCQGGDVCGHDVCTTGTPLAPPCDSCAALVCATEPGCCSTRWDAICVAQTKAICGLDCGENSGPKCGDGVCGPDESCITCSTDCSCGGSCGDGVCLAGETCGTCAADCGACPTCGDGTCGPAESCVKCPADCGACSNVCGDGTCSGAETCSGCPADCGACASCGDGLCSFAESCSTCVADCGPCVAKTCGNDVCEGGPGGKGESCSTCPSDCGTCSPLQHPLCEQGGPIAAGAHACAQEICKIDPFCCAGAWDESCVAEVGSACDLSCTTCGNGVCDPTDDCNLCGDCGACPAACGDGVCGAGESCDTCPFDCAPCAPLCGNGVCEYFGGETCGDCAADCGACPTGCGDGVCGGGETCTTCSLDCGPCAVVCGDSVCDAFHGESCTSCAADCGSCGLSCGDGTCSADESASTCAADCGPTTCTHSVCGVGAALAWNCDPCVREICEVDSYCCVNGWDPVCIWDVFYTCQLDCAGACGDGICHFDQGESCTTCPADCGGCTSL